MSTEQSITFWSTLGRVRRVRTFQDRSFGGRLYWTVEAGSYYSDTSLVAAVLDAAKFL